MRDAARDNVVLFTIRCLAATGAAALSLGVLTTGPGLAQAPTHTATAIVETEPAQASGDTVDDAAIWVNPADAAA